MMDFIKNREPDVAEDAKSSDIEYQARRKFFAIPATS
jgi:hypothetical protein